MQKQKLKGKNVCELRNVSVRVIRKKKEELDKKKKDLKGETKDKRCRTTQK